MKLPNIYFSFILLLLIINCFPSEDASLLNSKLSTLESELVDLRKEYLELKDLYSKTIMEVLDCEEQLTAAIEDTNIIGLWSTSWPVGAGITNGIIFSEDNTYIFQNYY